jgi:hypothetical protein
MIDLTLIKKETFYFIAFITFTAYLLRGNTSEILLQIIILGGIAWVGYGYLETTKKAVEMTNKNTVDFIDKYSETRNEAYTEIFSIGKFPGTKFTYLHKNQILVDIILNLKSIQVFDFAKFSDLILLMNQYQKVYIYILLERYNFDNYFTTFVDIGEKIQELLYSLYFIAPTSKLRHTYGYVPYVSIEHSINRFTVLRRKMINVLESFGKKQLNLPYIQETLTKPSDAPFDPIKTRMLP